MENEDTLSLKSENKIDDMDYESRIAEIDAALERNRLKMEEIEKALAGLDARKIFTLKELREMQKQKQREAEEKLENEKRMIDLVTEDAMKKAENLRKSAVTASEKVAAEEKALNIELSAVLHEIDIRKMIIKENEVLLEDVLAKLAIEKNNFQKHKESGSAGNKKYAGKEAGYKIRNKKEAFFSEYRGLKALVEKQYAKMEKAQNTLRSIHQKLKNNLNFNQEGI